MIRILLSALLLSCSAQLLAQSRLTLHPGEALYSTHCNACHTEQVHWRDNKLATNWEGIKAQVRRWQTNLNLSWSETEVDEVTRYLNTLYYRYPPQEPPLSRLTPPATKR